MSYENPQNIIRSWNQQTKFSLGPVVMDKLVPPVFGRIRTNHVNVWREEKLSANLDFGSKNFSVYLPESLRVLNSIYLQVDLPSIEAGTGEYKAFPALYIIDTIRLVSAGQEVYTCKYSDFLADYCQSLTQEELNVFGPTYLGVPRTAEVGQARRVMLPLLLPNSAYLGRHGKSSRGNGIFPAFLGQNRLEIQLTLHDAIFLTTDITNIPASISGSCSFLYHEAAMRNADVKKYSDMRGWYKIFTRRFTDLTSNWQSYPTPNAVVQWTISQPQGLCTEVMLLAVATDPNDHRLSKKDYIKATSFKVTADSIVQRDLNTVQKIDAELWSNGFVPPAEFPAPARICFGSHQADATHMYTGGYVMNLASNIVFEFSFAQACKFRLVAVQLQKVAIDSDGVMSAQLE